MTSSAGYRPRDKTRPAPLACTGCRLRHLKCDGKSPQCSRCLASNLSCQYLKSRRGGKRKRSSLDALDHAATLDPSSFPLTENEVQAREPPSQPQSQSQSSSSSVIISPDEGIIPQFSDPSPYLRPIPREPSQDDESAAEMSLVRLYYEHFHRAHPILLPEALYHQWQYSTFLTAVVVSIGRRFSTTSPAAPAKGSNTTQQLTALTEKSVSAVQAKLLHSIALWGEGSADEAKSLFVSARDLAIELHMHQPCPSSLDDQELESRRRTWWELYVIDSYMTAVWPEVGFLTGTLDCDVPVPRDEDPYTTISSPTTSTSNNNQLYQDFLLTEEDEQTLSMSSWWYRIKAASLIAKVVALDKSDPSTDKSEATMAALANWRLSLPQAKAQFMDPYGRVNQLLFEAEVLAQTATILLHFPRSDLSSDFAISTTNTTTTTTTTTTLASPTTTKGTARTPIRSCTKQVHGIKATEASKEISNLFSIYPYLEKSSPLLIPCLALCGMVQLATYRAHAPFKNCIELHGERVRLLTGLLKSAGEVWGSAKSAYSELKGAAVETFRGRKQKQKQKQSSQVPNGNYDPGYGGIGEGGGGGGEFQHGAGPSSSLPSFPMEDGLHDIGSWSWISDPTSQGNFLHRTDGFPLGI